MAEMKKCYRDVNSVLRRVDDTSHYVFEDYTWGHQNTTLSFHHDMILFSSQDMTTIFDEMIFFKELRWYGSDFMRSYELSVVKTRRNFARQRYREYLKYN